MGVSMNILKELVDSVRNEEYVYIQTHNFPDHDAVASAFGLQYLLRQFGKASHIIYEGDIQRDSLNKMIEDLNIHIRHNEEHYLAENHKIIIVDGCKGNKNVTDLVGDEIAVIDHHEVTATEDVRFVDIRPEYGACSSIIYDYFREYNLTVPRDVATALMIGINMDTALLTRGVSEADVQAYADLYPLADIRLQNSLLRNYIQTKDLEFYRYAINNVEIKNEVAFCYFPEGCNQNLLGILGDFFLALEEVDFVVLCAKNQGRINFSVRNEKKEWNAALIIQDVLKGIGFGGGHQDMAGGIINDLNNFDEKEIFGKFYTQLR
jgi:nanoRNase/pAp phosphatase (c-di-AMP/oligoRNAs hydrolase)